MVDGLAQVREKIHRKHLEIIQAMISTVEAKDSYTRGHCLRVRGYTKQILKSFDFISPGEKFLMETAALLHDIGKIGILDSILLKAGRLTKEEMEIIRSHVIIGENILIIGENILLHVDSMEDLAHWVRHHHEYWDGLGYPDGLRGEGLSNEDAVKALTDGKGKQFDPRIADCAVRLLGRREEKAEVLRS